MRGTHTAEITLVTFSGISTFLMFHKQLVMDSKFNIKILSRNFSLFMTGKQNVRLYQYEKQ